MLCWCLWMIAAAAAVYKAADWWLHRRRMQPAASVKAVLVTGCDCGFGRLLATRLSRKGWTVVAVCLTQQAVDELNRESGIFALQLDIRDAEKVEAAVPLVEAELKRRGLSSLWGVVNNAGTGGRKTGPFAMMCPASFRELFEVNVFGIHHVTRAFLPLLLRSRGRLVNTASILGRIVLPNGIAYGASKFSVEAMSDCYRRELRPFGVRVSCIEPGYHATGITQGASLQESLDVTFEEAPPAVQEAYGREFMRQCYATNGNVLRICSNRLGDVIDAYELALTAVRPRARYMIGWDAKLFFWPLSLLPEWLSDAVLLLRYPRPAAAVA